MRYFADLHVHSRHSLATSPACTLEGFAAAALVKGVAVVGTGDALHGAWLNELREKLEPAAPGLYRLRTGVADSALAAVRFMVTVEVSCVFRQGGRGRRAHLLIGLPSLAAAGRLRSRLAAVGKLDGDGRPVLRLSLRETAAAVLETAADALLIPAHIWTPWYAMLGSRSGFDSVEEAFGDLAGELAALETGLSSDPPMNWRVGRLDRWALLSASDAHSPAMLGRKATIFLGELDYFWIRTGLRGRDPTVLWGTCDLFPAVGKYHWDGHRACGVVLPPVESRRLNGICPVCARPLTLGVAHRVEALADHPAGRRPAGAAGFVSIIPLAGLVAECLGAPAAGRPVRLVCDRITAALGSELPLLLNAVPPEVEAAAGVPRLAEALGNLRAGRVLLHAGYDGVPGQACALSVG